MTNEFIKDLANKTSFDLIQIPREFVTAHNIEDQTNRNFLVKDNSNSTFFEGWLRVCSEGQLRIPKLVSEKMAPKKYTFFLKEISSADFQKYFDAFKSIASIHEALSFGVSPQVPSVFSESIARKYFKLYKPVGIFSEDGRAFDAYDFNGRRYEIKASTTPQGTVTIRPDVKFDFLIWLYFDLANEKIVLRKAKYDVFRTFLAGKTGSARVTITLNTFQYNEVKELTKDDL